MPLMDDRKPYLSLVLTGRNDNYGGDFKSRLQKCISNTFKQLNAASISSELIFVNYNPDQTNPPIEEFIEWPKSNDTVKVKVLTVPNEVHKELVATGEVKDVPVLEYMGKNAGIRRAKGEFILSMNPDIVLPQELVEQLKSLSKKKYYRADRVDFEGDLEGDYKYLRFFMKGHDHPLSSLDQISQLRKENIKENAWKIFTPNISWILNRFSKPVYYDNIPNRFHCNVSGDFMLMHRDHWKALHGHHQHTPIALHVDSLMVVQAAALKLKEHTFKHPIFHQEHTRRYDATLPDPRFKEAFAIFLADGNEMMRTGKPKIYNDANWGLSKFDLPELNL